MDIKDQYGFRVDSWNSKIAALGQAILESKSNSEIAELVGCTQGSASNYRKAVSEATGWTLPTSSAKRSESADASEKKPRATGNGKRKGCFPARASVIQCLNKYLHDITDSDNPLWIDEPTWKNFKDCRLLNGKDWQEFIIAKCKGQEEIDSFMLWIGTNDAADAAENAVSAARQKKIDDAIELLREAGYTVIAP